MLLAMASGVSEDEFVAGRRSGEFGTRPVPLEEIDKRNRKLARQLLWDALRGYTMTSGIAYWYLQLGSHVESMLIYEMIIGKERL